MQLEVNSGEELADMLEDPPTIKEKIIVSTPVTPTSNIPQVLTEKKSKQKRSCVLS